MFSVDALKNRLQTGLSDLFEATRDRIQRLWSDSRWRIALLLVPLLSAGIAFGLKVHQGSGLDLVITYRFSAEKAPGLDPPEAQIFFDLGEGVREEDSLAIPLKRGVNLSEMVFPYPNDLKDPDLRFDPSDVFPSQLEIYDLAFRDRITGKHLQKIKLSRITKRKEGVHVISTGDMLIIENLVDDPMTKFKTGFPAGKAIPKIMGPTAAIGPAILTGLKFGLVFLLGSLVWSGFSNWVVQLTRRPTLGPKLELGSFEIATTAAFAVATITLAWLFRGNYEAFRLIQEPFTPQFAGPKTPTSDALGIWITGALNFHALNEPYVSTYRCLPAIWHASFLSFKFDIAWVPMAMFFSWITVFTLFFLTANRVGKLYWLACVWGMVLTYDSNFRILAPHVFGPGMMAFGGGVVGIYLVAQAIFRPVQNAREWFLAGVGFLSLGIAGSVRGPQLLTGVSLLLLAGLVALLLKRPNLLWLIGIGAVCFLLPGYLDGQIRAKHQVTNNGWSALFCAYTDENHKWNPDLYIEEYLEHRPDGWEEQKAYHHDILKKFLQFRLSGEGWKDLGAKLWSRTYLDGRSLMTLPFQIIGCLFILSAWIYYLRSDSSCRLWIAIGITIHGFLPLLLGWVDHSHWQWMGHLLLFYMVVSVVLCIVLRLYLTMVVILAGYACMVFHASVGMTGSWRVAATYSNFMFLSYVLAPLELWVTRGRSNQEQSWSRPRFETGVGVLYLGFLAASSFGSVLIRSDFEKLHRQFYLQEGEQRLVMKLSNSTDFNRSLYLPPRGVNHVFYTMYDHLEPGFFRVVDPEYYPKENGWRTLIDPLELSPNVPPILGGSAEASAAQEKD